MPRHVAVDTGPLVALFDKNDADHLAAVKFFSRFRDRGFVTQAVVAEVTHLVGFHSQTPVDFLRWLLDGALAVVESTDDLPRIVELMVKYEDQPMDYANATIVAACERLGIRDVVTLDSDFIVYFKNRQVFRNLFPM
ncbi:MAG: hypothetical protein WD872_13870 [Pirellulaceae bacterium]